MQQLDVYYQLLSQHVSRIIMPIFRMRALYSARILQRSAPTTATNHIQQNQRSTPYAVTHGLCSPEDGHNGTRNMLRQKLIINIKLLHPVGFFSLFAVGQEYREFYLKP